jgi:hypothetical protein
LIVVLLNIRCVVFKVRGVTCVKRTTPSPLRFLAGVGDGLEQKNQWSFKAEQCGRSRDSRFARYGRRLPRATSVRETRSTLTSRSDAGPYLHRM